jgi:hypothetical protein
LWFDFVSIKMKFFSFWLNQFFSIRFRFAFDASVLSLLKYCWWKSRINSSIWTFSAYIHWFSISDQFNHLTRYCNRFRYNLLFNINFISSYLSSFIMIEDDVITSSNRFLYDFNKETCQNDDSETIKKKKSTFSKT